MQQQKPEHTAAGELTWQAGPCMVISLGSMAPLSRVMIVMVLSVAVGRGAT